MKKPESKFTYPADFEKFWQTADKDTKKKAAYIGYLKAKQYPTHLLQALKGIREGQDVEEK